MTPTILESKKKELYEFVCGMMRERKEEIGEQIGWDEDTANEIYRKYMNKLWDYVVTNFQPGDEKR